MTRVAVIGANGQVASEICLLLRNHPSIELVPICRNPTGSAFLRYRGIACRHGHVTDPHSAPRLLRDCDVVLNLALPVGQPRYAHETARRLIENSVRYSPPGATIVYFSTQCVYRSFRPSGSAPWRSAYGAEKLRCERLARRSASRDARKVFVIRLGHVCGELQNMTRRLREMIETGRVSVPEGGAFDSNVIHTVTIVDAVIRILGGSEKPGTYDLINVPQWTWRRVLEHEAVVIGCELTLAPSGGGVSVPGGGPLGRLAGAARATLPAPTTREIGLRLLARLPENMNERAQAQHFRRRATAEAAARGPSRPMDSFAAFTFGAGGTDFLRSLSPTEDLLAAPTAQIAEWDAEAAFPPDLPPAGS